MMRVNLTIGIPEWFDRIFAWPAVMYRKWKYGYSYRRIGLTEGKYTLVDEADYYRLNNFYWIAKPNGKSFTAARFMGNYWSGSKIIYLHREIMNPPAGVLVDHKNGDALDNRRDNLRLATYAQNAYNKKKTRAKTSSRFIGVCFSKKTGKWTAYLRFEGKRIWLGQFDNEIDAAKAHDKAAIEYHKEFARLNFPEENSLSATC
jgi:hypothetical protein